MARRATIAPQANVCPRVVAVVLNWCGEDDTRECLLSLGASEYPALEVLLVDNGSPDGSGERLRSEFPDIAYLQTEDNLGYTGGNNRGLLRALEAGADYVLVLNNDTEVEPGCVTRLVEAARAAPDVGAVGPKILLHADPGRIWFAGGDFSWSRAVGVHRGEGERDPNPEGGPVEEVSFLTGCCLLLPKEALARVGLFSEDLFAYVEDVDLSLRLRQAGYRLLYQPNARLLHRVDPVPAPPSPFQIFHRDRNRRRVVRRHYSRPQRMRFALRFYPTRLLRALQYLARGDLERTAALWRALRAP